HRCCRRGADHRHRPGAAGRVARRRHRCRHHARRRFHARLPLDPGRPAILAVLGSGVGKVVLAIVLVQWSYYARTSRSLAMSELGREYVEAARCLRLPASRIMLRHVLPNCMPQIIVLFAINIAAAIALESSLSFLGVGLPLTEPSLGMLIANGY